MPTNSITFKNTGYFSNLICDYIAEAKKLQPFYNRFPKLENFKSQIEEKSKSFSKASRVVLSNVLKEQYANINASELSLKNIEALSKNNTFTVTTGHQLNLFTGPLYFLHKIVSTINLARKLEAEHPNSNFVPIYWMATEDHDFEEINYFNFKGRKLQWNHKAKGVVGAFNTEGLETVFETFSNALGLGNNANKLRALFKEAYCKHNNLSDATRYLANALFSEYGLVIIDANNKALKQLFVPQIEKELVQQVSYKKVSKTNQDLLKLDLKIQVNPRAINLFYISKNLRERIVLENEVYKVLNTSITWSQTDIIKEVNKYPERFSPNVILRPLYQEVVLPNLCYIGGGGELAYWFQLKSNFKANNIVFPMLLLRNSVLIKTEQQEKKLNKLNISDQDLFLKRDVFINKRVRAISNLDINFSIQKEHLKKQFKYLYEIAKQTDVSFVGAVSAQEKKQVNGLENLEKRLLTAQKRKLKAQVARMTQLQNALFPNNSLQERNTNFSELYLEFGTALIPKLIQTLNPLNGTFTIVTL